jgi:hypothetical protein
MVINKGSMPVSIEPFVPQKLPECSYAAKVFVDSATDHKEFDFTFVQGGQAFAIKELPPFSAALIKFKKQ